jgi:hypothetical protein
MTKATGHCIWVAGEVSTYSQLTAGRFSQAQSTYFLLVVTGSLDHGRATESARRIPYYLSSPRLE